MFIDASFPSMNMPPRSTMSIRTETVDDTLTLRRYILLLLMFIRKLLILELVPEIKSLRVTILRTNTLSIPSVLQECSRLGSTSPGEVRTVPA